MAKYQKYAEYKDSGIEFLGEVPEHWDIASVRRYLVDHRQGYYTTESYVDEGLKLLRITDLSDLGEIDTQNCPMVKETESTDLFKLKKGDVVFARTGGAGSFGVITKKYDDLIYASYLIRFRFMSAKLEPNYLRYLCLSDSFQLSVKQNIHGGVNQNIHAEDIKNTIISVPTLLEQNQIATFLDFQSEKINSLITKQEKLIELLKEKRQAVISHAVTKGLNPDVVMKDSGVEWLGQVPEHWQLVPLKYLCTFSGGGTPTKDNLSYWTDGNIPWVSPKDMKTFWISETQDYITEKAVKESSTNIVEQNSLLMVVRSGILQRTIPIAINTVPVTMNQDMKALKFGKRVLVEYIANLIHGNTAQLLLEWSKEGATVESIEHEYLANSLIPVPSLKEQEEITQVIAKKMKVYAELTEKAELQITLLQERRTALISSAVTGKINVTNWQHPNKNNEATTELGA
ncbi:restriction endonuclease subunit S [uncultured Acinetobacter sp.]|uniref:restriction endonuclease subunit S n=1 Tax=uncultured Acinetobacter sp. TaxID=165433 RepID=UPI002619B103|nr:restriction endonuclease subunit S [uncultured Acinetobacter sp.]